MASRTPKGILIAVIVWIVIIGGIAATLRCFVLPEIREKKRSRLALQTGSGGRYRAEVRLAADSFSGYCILRSPELAGRLGAAGIKLTVQDDGADYLRRMKKLQNGDIDMAVFPVNSFIQSGMTLGDFPASIVYVVDETVGADAIIAYRDAVPAIDALNRSDARIVLTPDSPSELLARVMIASFNLPELPEKEWMVAADGSSDVYRKFRGDTRRRPVAYALWEPDVSRALKQGDAHVLLDSSRMKGFIVDVLVVERQFLIEHYDVVKQLVEDYARTAYENRQTMPETIVADARLFGGQLDDADARRLAQGIRWKNTLENYAHFGVADNAHSLENIEDIILKITDVLVRTGALERPDLSVPPNALYFNRIVSEMKSEHFHPGRDIHILSGTGTAAGDDETVRSEERLRALSEAQWASLLPVGELRVEPVSFGRGTARINLQSLRELKALARTLNSWPQYYLTVTGTVRPGGDEQAALALAKARADAAVEVLVNEGVAPERIRAFSKVAEENSATAQSVSFMVEQLPY